MSTETVDIIVRESGASEAAAGVTSVGTAAEATEAKVEGLNGTLEMLSTTLAGLGAAFEVSSFIEMADTTQVLTDRMNQFTQSSQDVNDTWTQLLGIADQTHQSLDSTADLYLKLVVAGQSLKVSQDDLLTITKVLDESLATSGKSADEAGRSLIALTRALQSGTITTQVFTAMQRTMQPLLQTIANNMSGMNGSVVNLQEAMKAGTVTVADFFNAIIKGAGDSDAANSKMTLTVNKAWIDLKNNLENYVRTADEANGFTGALASVIEFLAQHISGVAGLLGTLAVGLTAYAVAAGIAALATMSVGASFTSVVVLAAMAYTAFESLDGPLGLVTGALIALTAIQAASWFMSLAAGVRVAVAAVGLFALEIGGAVVAALAIFTAAMDVAVIAVSLFHGQSMQQAITSAKQFNQEMINAAQSGITSFASSLKEQATPALQSATEGLRALSTELINNSGAANTAAAAHTANATAVGTSTAAHQAHLPVIQAVGTAYKETKTSVDQWGQSITTTTNSLRQYDGSLNTFSETIKKVSGGTTTLTEMNRGLDGQLQAVKQTVDTVNGSIKTSTDYVMDYDGSWAQVSQTVTEQAVPALNSAAAAIQNVTSSAAAGSAAMSGLMSSLGGGGASMFGGVSADMSSGTAEWKAEQANQARADWYKNNVNLGTGGGAFFAAGGEFTIPHAATGMDMMVGGQGGTDSQLVQFMASPDETVTVRTPSQMAASGQGGGAITMPISMTIVTPDAQSFRRNQSQIIAGLADQIRRVNSRLGRA